MRSFYLMEDWIVSLKTPHSRTLLNVYVMVMSLITN